jgi:hypothetical protein
MLKSARLGCRSAAGSGRSVAIARTCLDREEIPAVRTKAVLMTTTAMAM